MKICSECRKPLPDEIAYCVYCGSRTDLPQQTRAERKLFFLTPVFLFLVSTAFTYDLTCNNYFETAIVVAGVLSFLYFFGAITFYLLKFFFNTCSMPSSYFNAGMTALINGITVTFTATAIENLCFLDKLEKIGPTALVKNHIILMAIIYLPIQIMEILAISAKAKVTKHPESAKSTVQRIIFSKAYIAIPILFFLAGAIGVYCLPEPTRISMLAESYLTISAYDKAQKTIDAGLKKYPDSANLCSLKSLYLSEYLSSKNITPGPAEIEQQAIEYAVKAVEKKPDSPIYRFQLCKAYELNHRVFQAITTASEAASLANNDPYLWQYAGDLNYRFNHFPEAIIAYKKVLSIEPENPATLNNLAYALLLNNEDIELAIELAKKAIELKPYTIANYDTLAWAYYKNGNYAEALDTIGILYENRNEISPEIDFHRAAILNAMDLLNNPVETFDKMLVKPEILLNIPLVNEIIKVRQKAFIKLQETNEPLSKTSE